MVKPRPEKAFPSTFKSFNPEESQVHVWGMDLRDYFAAKAMQHLIGIFVHDPTIDDPDERRLAVARAAYLQADAMMKAREAK